MGKSQSKLSPEQLADLQKNTYCQFRNILYRFHLILYHSRQERATAMVLSIYRLLWRTFHLNRTTGIRAFSRIVHPASWTRLNSVVYINNSFHSGIQETLQTTSSTYLTRTKMVLLTSRSSYALSVSRAVAD